MYPERLVHKLDPTFPIGVGNYLVDKEKLRFGASVVHGSVQWHPEPDWGSGEFPIDPDAHLALQAEPRPPPSHSPAAAQVTNWPAYDASLRQRGNVTVWLPRRRSPHGRPSHARHEVASPGIRCWRS